MKAGFHPSHKSGGKKKSLKENGFYHTTAWRRLRLLALQRDHFLCQECLKHHKFTAATEVHHVRELEEFPELGLDLGNLVSLCWSCHEETKRRSKRAEPPSTVRVICVSDGKETEGWQNAD